MSETLKDVNADFFNVNIVTQKIVLPSGMELTIRESNGEDEELLSRVPYLKDGTAYYRFLANIITEPRMDYLAVQSMKSNDMYATLLKARILSLGNKLEFKHTFRDGTVVDAEEDLADYNRDYSKDYTDDELSKFNKATIKPYKEDCGEYFHFTTSSDKIFRMKYLTGSLEIKTLDLKEDTLTFNDKLKVREIEMKTPAGGWVRLHNFKTLSSRDMKELRGCVEREDTIGTLTSTLEHQGKTEEISLFLSQDFFFPQA
jgi:predicted metal-dependent hydrolase